MLIWPFVLASLGDADADGDADGDGDVDVSRARSRARHLLCASPLRRLRERLTLPFCN